MAKLYTVYQITNLINNRKYIGIHKEKPNEPLRAYMGSGVAIKAAIKKYGVENFHKEILYRFDTYEEMVAMEEQLVTKDIIESTEYYNRQTGGGYGIPSEATRVKQSEATKGEKNPCYGKRGKDHPFYGKKHSEATRAKMSESQKGEKNHQAKPANIYDSKTHRLIAEAVVIKEWCRENPYDQGNLSATARADRTIPNSTTNPHQHKGIYARYTE